MTLRRCWTFLLIVIFLGLCLALPAQTSLPRNTPGPARFLLRDAPNNADALRAPAVSRPSAQQLKDIRREPWAEGKRLRFAEERLRAALDRSCGDEGLQIQNHLLTPDRMRDGRWVQDALRLAGQVSKEARTAISVQALTSDSFLTALAEPKVPLAGFKQSTGWILDARVYDPTIQKSYPGVLQNLRENDEGGSGMAMGADGWVWQVHSFWWTEVTADHPNASECLSLMVSPDGGARWYLYSFLYDPLGKDMLNPKLALDITGTYERFFIAYEYAYSATDHDISVYSETSVLGGGTANPQDAAVAATALMERHPAILSSYTSGQTAYRVAAWEQEYTSGSGDYDIWAAQSTGAGAQADWAAGIAVANTGAYEGHPALSAGASGGALFTQYAHLAYNYDTFTPTQLLLNPGFELGNNTNWTVRVAGDISCSGTNVRTGTCKAWLGGTTSQPNDWIYQTVTIPANATSAQLSLWLKIATADSLTIPYDYLNLEIRDTSGVLLRSLGQYSNANASAFGTYAQLAYGLNEFIGQTIRVHLWASNDGSGITSFYIDDTAMSIVTPASGTAHEIRYARAAHPGATPYPQGLLAAAKTAILTNVGAAWPYGPASVVASHGGSATMTPARVIVAADQWFPADNPTAGDPARYQVCYAWNTCNGATTCGTITCTPSNLSLNWVENYIYESKADCRYPSLTTDGSGVANNGIVLHPLLYLGYYFRDQTSPKPYGQATMLITDASDESCAGFATGGLYYFTASNLATDSDDLVYPQEGTINAFNYWDGYPGIAFHKRVTHFSGTENLDPFFTTIGENYFFDTLYAGSHIEATLELDATTYSSPYTFPWAAGYNWTVTAQNAVINGRWCPAISWSDGTVGPTITVLSDYCDGVTTCPTVSYLATYSSQGCLVAQPEVANDMMVARQGSSAHLTWTQTGAPGDADHYTILRATDPSQAANFSAIANASATSFLDGEILPDTVVYYLVTAGCGPYSGPWGAYGQ